jgi:hypothetical protein
MLSRKDLTSSMRVIIDKWDNEIDGLEEDIREPLALNKKQYLEGASFTILRQAN